MNRYFQNGKITLGANFDNSRDEVKVRYVIITQVTLICFINNCRQLVDLNPVFLVQISKLNSTRRKSPNVIYFFISVMKNRFISIEF